MKTTSFLILVLFAFFNLSNSLMSTAADNATPPDPALEAKKREAEMAEADARIAKAQKEIAQAKKDTDTATNDELQRAEQAKAKAQAEQAIADAEKAKFNASLPTTTSKPLEGKVDIDDKAGYFSEILAYESAKDNALAIATNLTQKVKGNARIFLVKQPDYLKNALLLAEIEKRLETFDATFGALSSRYTVQNGTFVINEAAPLAALAAAPAIIGALADIAALFRVDRTIKGRATSVTDDTLLAETAHALEQMAAGKLEIVRLAYNTAPSPTILTKLQTSRLLANAATVQLIQLRGVLANVGVTLETKQSQISSIEKDIEALRADSGSEVKDIKEEMKRLRGLYESIPSDKAAERERVMNSLKQQDELLIKTRAEMASRLNSQFAQLQTLRDQMIGPKNQKGTGDVAAGQYEAVLKGFGEFTTKLVSVPDGGTHSPLATLSEVAMLRDLNPGDYILTVAVAGQGGEVETRKSLWTSGKIYHRAGTACTYSLFEKNGKVVDSGLVVANRQMKEGRPIGTRRKP